MAEFAMVFEFQKTHDCAQIFGSRVSLGRINLMQVSQGVQYVEIQIVLVVRRGCLIGSLPLVAECI